MNGFDEPQLKFVCGDLADKVTKKYDVVVEGRDGYYLNQEMFETDLVATPIEVVAEIDTLKGTILNNMKNVIEILKKDNPNKLSLNVLISLNYKMNFYQHT